MLRRDPDDENMQQRARVHVGHQLMSQFLGLRFHIGLQDGLMFRGHRLHRRRLLCFRYLLTEARQRRHLLGRQPVQERQLRVWHLLQHCLRPVQFVQHRYMLPDQRGELW